MKNVVSRLALMACLVTCLGFVSCTECDETAKKAAEVATKNKAACQKSVDAMNTGNLALLDSVFDPSFVEHTPDPMIEEKGIAGLKKSYEMMRSAYPDVKIEVVNTAAEGDMVFMHQTFIGTNTGPMGPMPPTGKAVKADGVDVFKLKDGKIVEHWGIYDTMTMMSQMGMTVVPMPADSSAAMMEGGDHAGHDHEGHSH